MKKLMLIFAFWFITGLILTSSAQIIHIDQTFTSDTSFKPFTGSTQVYSLKIDCKVELFSDSSLVRVILIDDRSSHYLIYEAYPLISHSTSFSINDACDETCFMDGIFPDSIRIEIINAQIAIGILTFDNNYIANVANLQAQTKWHNDSIKIALMNQRIKEENMYWRAGRTPLTGLNYIDRERYFGIKYNIAGFDFYKGGVFEFFHRRSSMVSPSTSAMVGEFDWRNRHNASTNTSHYFNQYGDGWITFPENQLSCNSCYVFSDTHTFADFINVHCNNFYNYDLSEEEALICTYSGTSYSCGNCATGGFPSCVLDFIKNHGVHQETACSSYMTTPAPACATVCWSDPSFKFTDFFSAFNTEDQLKLALIQNGPISSGLDNTIFAPYGHAMELIAYKTIQAGDTVYITSNDTIIVGNNSNLIGKVSWIFKNSLDPNQYFRYYGLLSTIHIRYALSGAVTKTVGSNTVTMKPVCKDEDGDGFFWWGVGGLNPDCGCPPGVTADQEDCNDNNPLVGPYVTTVNNPDSLHLYTCAPNKCTTLSSNININNDTTWTGIRHINQNIVIRPQKTLIIKGQLFFSPGAKIIVQSQGLLVLKGDSIITPARLSSGCGQLWGGVELLGDPLQSQDSIPNLHAAQNQGTIIIYNGIIENAICGIKTFNTNAIQQKSSGGFEQIGYPSGGVIKAELATFRNNKTGVELCPYRNGNKGNRSDFKACTFITTDSLLNAELPAYLLKLDGVNTLKIKGTSFKNRYFKNQSMLPVYRQRGTGIYCYNSSMEIDSLHETAAIFGIDSVYKPVFENMRYGIYAINSSLGYAKVNLAKAQFYSNNFGAYFSGFREVNPLDINHNCYSLNSNFGADTIYCLYLDHCSGYKVTKNSFDASGVSNTVKKLGIIVNNSGARTNYIYNNGPFKQFTNALQGQNINHGIYLPDGWDPGAVPLETGLHFICNDFDFCKNDIIINQNSAAIYNGIDYYQKNCAGVPNDQKPSGNTFTSDLSSGIHSKDIDNDEYVNNIQYSYHHSGPANTRLKPLQSLITNPNKVILDEMFSSAYSKTASCPDSFYPVLNLDELREGITQSDYKIDSLMSLLSILTDNGSTDSLANVVINGTPPQSYDIYQNLLNISPYLSDTVLKTSIIHEEVLPNAMLRDVMVANPQSAKNEDLLTTLDNRFYPMPDSLWDEILSGQDTIGAMERLEGEVRGWIQNRDVYFNSLINLFVIDPVYSASGDSLISALQNDHHLGSRYNLIEYNLSTHNFSMASDILEDIPFDFPLTAEDQVSCRDFGTLIPLLEQLVNDTTGYKPPDSIQCLALLSLADHENLPGMYARNFLVYAGYLNYYEPVILETTLKTSKTLHHYGRKIELFSDIKIYPNPCNDYLIIDYSRENSGSNLYVEILDSKGIIVGTYLLKNQSNLVVIPFNDYYPGIYFFRFSIKGVTKQISRVVHI